LGGHRRRSLRGRLHVQLALCSGDDAADARRRRRLLGTAQIGKTANHLVRVSGPVSVSMPDHEHRHRHNRGDGDRGELGDTDRCDGCDAGP
jgi:hypothetical protein